MSWLSSFFKSGGGGLGGPQQFAVGEIQRLLSPAGKATQYQGILDELTRASRMGQEAQRRQLARRGITRGTAGVQRLPEGWLQRALEKKREIYGGQPDLFSILAGVQERPKTPSPFSTILGGIL